MNDDIILKKVMNENHEWSRSGRWPQPNDKSRELLRLMSSCPMSFARVPRPASRVKQRDGNAMTPLVQGKSNQDCFFREGMRSET